MGQYPCSIFQALPIEQPSFRAHGMISYCRTVKKKLWSNICFHVFISSSGLHDKRCIQIWSYTNWRNNIHWMWWGPTFSVREGYGLKWKDKDLRYLSKNDVLESWALRGTLKYACMSLEMLGLAASSETDANTFWKQGYRSGDTGPNVIRPYSICAKKSCHWQLSKT